MKDAFKAVKVTDKVYWVGAIDWAVIVGTVNSEGHDLLSSVSFVS